MIQRIQSLYLFLVLLLLLLSFFISWVTYYQADSAFIFEPLSSDPSALSVMLTSVMVLVFGAITLAALVSFKSRKRQMTLVRTAIVFAFLIIAAFAFDHYQNIQVLKANGEMTMNYGLPAVFPLVNLILLWMAHRGVKKDEDLIKSVDRLR
jgi:glucan phosphoethanolaminetransferase (alkaline phosphatase superfamily)